MFIDHDDRPGGEGDGLTPMTAILVAPPDRAMMERERAARGYPSPAPHPDPRVRGYIESSLIQLWYNAMPGEITDQTKVRLLHVDVCCLGHAMEVADADGEKDGKVLLGFASGHLTWDQFLEYAKTEIGPHMIPKLVVSVIRGAIQLKKEMVEQDMLNGAPENKGNPTPNRTELLAIFTKGEREFEERVKSEDEARQLAITNGWTLVWVGPMSGE